RRLRPAMPFNQRALVRAAAGAPTIHLASSVLGSAVELPGPEAALLAELCVHGTQAAGPPALAPLRQSLLAERVPLLLRLGALMAA
ncbi:MAG: hypothetical protein ABI661_02815, partial [Gammaproteobacteria bacterium]